MVFNQIIPVHYYDMFPMLLYSELARGVETMLKWILTIGVTMIAVSGCTTHDESAPIQNYKLVNEQETSIDLLIDAYDDDKAEEEKMYTEKDVDLMARTIWGEARGQSDKEMEAVANVIVNRLIDGRWGDNLRSVIMFPYAFTCHYDGNKRKLNAVTIDDHRFVRALKISRDVLESRLNNGHNHTDPSNGATHYHAHWVKPRWANKKMVVAMFSGHVFYAGTNDKKWERTGNDGKFIVPATPSKRLKTSSSEKVRTPHTGTGYARR